MIDVETFAAAKSYTDSHGGSGGTTNYNDLNNLPQINGEELSGNKSAEDLGLVASEAGKGLSTNDYSDEEKSKVTSNAEAIEAMVNVNGAKNVLPFDLNLIKKKSSQGTWNGNTYSYNGIDYTVNDDNTITVNGTATELSYIYLLFDQTLCEGGDYLLNGNMSGTEAEYTTYFYIFDNTTRSMIGYLYGSEDMDFSYVDGHSLTAGIEIPQGKTINNFIFKPMIRDARITDSTYVPYAMTNRELTERMATITGIYDTGGVGIQTIPYPPGFTKDNCIAILLSSDSLGKRYAIATTQTNVALDNSNIQIYNENTSFKGYSFTVTLIKI